MSNKIKIINWDSDSLISHNKMYFLIMYSSKRRQSSDNRVFAIRVSVRLSDRSSHREEQKKIRQKLPQWGLNPGPLDHHSNALMLYWLTRIVKNWRHRIKSWLLQTNPHYTVRFTVFFPVLFTVRTWFIYMSVLYFDQKQSCFSVNRQPFSSLVGSLFYIVWIDNN